MGSTIQDFFKNGFLKMKKSTFLLGLLTLYVSCERTECCLPPSPEILGLYVHDIPNCDNMNNLEINCTEFVKFVTESEVDLLYGGADIVHRFSYTRKGNILDLQGPLTSSFKVSFRIKDSRTLIRIDNGDVWIKSE